MDYQLIVAGHLFLPGGGLGAPQARDRSGGIRQRGTLPQMYWLLFGDVAAPAGNTLHHVMAVGRNYRPPQIIRSLFVDKPKSGYEFWNYTDHPVAGPKPHSQYDLGPAGTATTVGPWQAVMMPDGKVQMGINYEYRFQSIHVSMGVYAKDDQGGFQILYHHQPWVTGDTTHNPGRSLPSGRHTDPDAFIRENYDYERLMVGRTMLSLWDPTLENKPEGVVRTHQDTRVHLPNWGRHGGEMHRSGDWFVGRMHETYIAYLPLGPIEVEETRDGGDWIYLRLQERSGCIVELATADQFPSLEAYGQHLQQRHLRFNRDPLWVEFEALEVGSAERDTISLRLEHHPERRFIDGRERTMQQLDRGFIDSPFVRWDWNPRRMILQREGYGRIVYEVEAARIGDPSP